MQANSVQAQQDDIISLSSDLPGSFTLVLSLPRAMPVHKHGNRVAAHELANVNMRRACLGPLRSTGQEIKVSISLTCD